VEIKFSIERVVMQPTQLCNLNCSYCYLPDRDKNRKMTSAVAEKVALEIAELNTSVEVIWHGGEPLSCGLDHFSQLVSPLEQLRKQGFVRHGIQTNATLIDDRWCELFRYHQFRVGVSLDGPVWTNTQRVGWNNQPAFDKIMRGINYLKEADIPFSIICVVGKNNLDKAKELYKFFAGLGCASLGINIEEQLGVHTIESHDNMLVVTAFWQQMFSAWRENPVIKMRDFARMLPALATLSNETQNGSPKLYDIFPSVAWNGDVVLLAPEFLNTNIDRYNNFVVGNVFNESLQTIIKQGEQTSYVKDYIRGVTSCKKECEYFSLCYGGQAGNKFFEHGTINVTETAFCRNSEKSLANAILQQLEQS